VIKMNKVFAAVPLVSIEVLSYQDKALVKAIQKKTNINGSAIAIGHPNTTRGARLMMNLMNELRRRDRGYAL
jgi:acetyl-CoA C-acetyltransferase